jgi:hypothetical protein
MRVGIVSLWFNRGQAVVSRRIRAALDQAGLWTAVLARPAPTASSDLASSTSRDRGISRA